MRLSFNVIITAVFAVSAFAAPRAEFRNKHDLDYQDYPNGHGHLVHIEPSGPVIANSNTAASDSPRVGGSCQVVPLSLHTDIPYRCFGGRICPSLGSIEVEVALGHGGRRLHDHS
ncbi:hypothetical protein EV421DRAFT_1494638 [Armillaria borealis]|uniref:Uncharacterized protein n=1 Tax=Armillaria borealis TaxID=47425 RepID=A0AA39IY73_9AGAR|nr:hypothetical protein EV421DRAFT_1494638 [Armillaria borealis]